MYPINLEDYRSELTRLASVWATAMENIIGAKGPELSAGDQVMVYMTSEVQGKKEEVSPVHSMAPADVTPTDAEVVLVDHTREPSILLALSCAYRCYKEKNKKSWTGSKQKRRKRRTV